MGEAEIQQWLVDRVARQLELSPSQIDATEPFVRYGIDSVTTTEIIGELADWMGQPVDPALVWDCPDLASFARELASSSRPAAP